MPNYGLPSPRTWTDGVPVPLAPGLRQDAGGGAAWLNGPPFFIGAADGTPQSIATEAEVQLNTELYDPWNMHHLQGSPLFLARCYPQQAGWYLCQAFTPMAPAASAGWCQAGVAAAQGGGSATQFTGQSVLQNTAWPSGPVAAKLVQISDIGGYANGDWAAAYVWQNSDSAVNMEFSASTAPRFEMRWIGAASGTAPLPAPPFENVPVPPFYLDAGWLNRNVRDTVRYLIYPPFGEWYNAGLQTLPSSTGLETVGFPLDLTHTVADSYSAVNLGTGTFTVPADDGGTYWVYHCMSLVAETEPCNAAAAGVTVTSANYNNGDPVTLWQGAQAMQPSATMQVQGAVYRRRLRLNPGDTIQPAGYQNSVSGADAEVSSRLIVIWRSL